MVGKRQTRQIVIPVTKYPFTPDTYPGCRPPYSFFFTPQGIYRLNLRGQKHLLASQKLAPVGRRFAILAYGSNGSPGQLLRKYQKHGLTNVPVLFGRLVGAMAVYAHRKTEKDKYVVSTLARKKGSRSSWVTMLSKEQLPAMDRSEGRPDSYELVELLGAHFYIGRSRLAPLYSYVEVAGGVMTLNGKTLSLHSTSQKRARVLFATTKGEDAHSWLKYKIVPNPNPPAAFSHVRKS